MPRNELGGLRRSQAISTHGPGAIVDFRPGQPGASVSAVAAGLEAWDERARKKGLSHDQRIYEPRLQAQLGVDGFRLPPVTPQSRPGVAARTADVLLAVRFPNWLQCPRCHVLRPSFRWDEDEGKPAKFCRPCTDEMGNRVFTIPARFIRACDHGHLDDFPWDIWVRHDDDCSKRRGLKLESIGAGGLASLILSCRDCGAQRSMDGCFNAPEIRKLKCQGRRPWLATNDLACSSAEGPRVLQRGASNIYFPFSVSALDIPPWSDPVQSALQQSHDWQKLIGFETEEKRKQYLELVDVGATLNLGDEVILERVRLFLERRDAASHIQLRWEEYQQLNEPQPDLGENSNFKTRQELVDPRLDQYLTRLVAATRLREVRALTGFTRIHPPTGSRDPRMAPIQERRHDWLPAIEVRGEGLFIELNRETIDAWRSAYPEVERRAGRINHRYAEDWNKRYGGIEPPRVITAKFLLVHSLAHALIEQLALTCGYASASLRERLYIGDGAEDMAGLLIYTASADAEGTLGGLSRQARSKDFAATLIRTIAASEWCSSDPLCADQQHSLSHHKNGAACHACLLTSETSCEEFNFLLDRAMLVGTPENREMGFFSGLLRSLGSEGL